MRAQRYANKKRDKTQMCTIWYARARKYTRRERYKARNTLSNGWGLESALKRK